MIHQCMRMLKRKQMDRLRLVMPPLLFSALSFPFTRLAYNIFPTFVANGVISGAFFFYIGCKFSHFSLLSCYHDDR
jgi:4-hydroxysphinganine ceramide fatty acyl 2-hydroxylase